MFEAFLTNPPTGFDAACTLANGFPAPVFGQLVRKPLTISRYQAFDVSGYLQGTSPFPDIADFVKKLANSTNAQVDSVANSLVLILRSAARESEVIEPATFLSLIQSKTLLSDELAQMLARVWQKEVRSNPQFALLFQNSGLKSNVSVDRAVSVGKVISMDWRLSVGFGSSVGDTQPHVMIALKVANMQNVTKTHTFELTIPEFKAFAGTFEKMKRGLEMYS